MKPKRLISRAVLKTELSMISKLIAGHNFGYAVEMVEKILNRVDEYDCPGGKKEARK